ncbi:MAG: ABC transporter substrate-binding protein [Planctomycetota bacterium]
MRLTEPFRRFHAPETAPPEKRPRTHAIGMVTTPGDPLGESRVRGAALAVDLANEGRGGGEARLRLEVGRSDGPWSSAAAVARDLLYERRCLALITPPDRATSHLLEQVAARAHAPLVSLSGASALTRVPVPWLARVVPDDRAQIGALIEALPPEASRGPIPALVPAGRDGEAVRSDLAAVAEGREADLAPVIAVGELCRGLSTGGESLGKGPVLVWLGRGAAWKVLRIAAEQAWAGPLLLPREVLDGVSVLPPGLPPCLTVRLFEGGAGRGEGARFARAYRRRHGVQPDEAAACAFDAASILVEAISHAGASRAGIRGRLSAMGARHGVTGPIRLDGTGNRRMEASVWRLGRACNDTGREGDGVWRQLAGPRCETSGVEGPLSKGSKR